MRTRHRPCSRLTAFLDRGEQSVDAGPRTRSHRTPPGHRRRPLICLPRLFQKPYQPLLASPEPPPTPNPWSGLEHFGVEPEPQTQQREEERQHNISLGVVLLTRRVEVAHRLRADLEHVLVVQRPSDQISPRSLQEQEPAPTNPSAVRRTADNASTQTVLRLRRPFYRNPAMATFSRPFTGALTNPPPRKTAAARSESRSSSTGRLLTPGTVQAGRSDHAPTRHRRAGSPETAPSRNHACTVPRPAPPCRGQRTTTTPPRNRQPDRSPWEIRRSNHTRHTRACRFNQAFVARR